MTWPTGTTTIASRTSNIQTLMKTQGFLVDVMIDFFQHKKLSRAEPRKWFNLKFRVPKKDALDFLQALQVQMGSQARRLPDWVTLIYPKLGGVRNSSSCDTRARKFLEDPDDDFLLECCHM
eukprot:TRINITY_DN278_c0_g1::TRINITY_DN278_c0_g1_i1::g.1706::m.1706 TRINITY_DN278_c0_g1::TRINITY_DN278_c0_g1_i1::g.1706  ORF type:complete len:121 (+),score=3.45,TFIID_30kDa/PF03540.8/3.9,TFIID_30kDa/PF03540.8/64 TRINITY_DN278_c0_g1_i1:66-428(+)